MELIRLFLKEIGKMTHKMKFIFTAVLGLSMLSSSSQSSIVASEEDKTIENKYNGIIITNKYCSVNPLGILPEHFAMYHVVKNGDYIQLISELRILITKHGIFSEKCCIDIPNNIVAVPVSATDFKVTTILETHYGESRNRLVGFEEYNGHLWEEFTKMLQGSPAFIFDFTKLPKTSLTYKLYNKLQELLRS